MGLKDSPEKHEVTVATFIDIEGAFKHTLRASLYEMVKNRHDDVDESR